MLLLVLSMLTMSGEVPTLPKPGELIAPEDRAWRQSVFDLMKQVQVDPAFAHIETVGERSAIVYFKGDSDAHLARYTRDPRFVAESVPLSAIELGEISRRFMIWVNRHGFEWEHSGANPKTGIVGLGTRNPAAILAAAKAEGFDLSHIRIYDSTPHYVNERG